MKIRIGTRGSLLALTQAHSVKQALLQVSPKAKVELIPINTLGDRKQGTPAASISDKKEWVQDLEFALLQNKVDIVVHCGKDIPIDLVKGTALIPVLARANPFDAFIGKINPDTGLRLTLNELPQNACVGTASLRRQAQLLRFRPDLSIVEHRGNVPTRIQKLDACDRLAGIVLACAGIERLQLDVSYELLPAKILLPAINQGTLVVQFREEEDAFAKLLSLITEPNTIATFSAERSVAEVLEGSCQSAIGIFCESIDTTLTLTARVMHPNGSQCIEVNHSAPVDHAKSLGLKVGNDLLIKGAKELLNSH